MILKKSNKRQKILIQMGVVMVLQFMLMTIAVGNMITMSSFSTSLSGNMESFEYLMLTLGDNLTSYKTMSWLMDYWKEHADEMVTEDDQLVETDSMLPILSNFSKNSASDVTVEEVESLFPEDQFTFAVGCYREFIDIFETYSTEDDDYVIILAMSEEEDEEPVAILTNSNDEGIILGKTADIQKVRKIIANTKDAKEAEVWKWAFSTPSDMMLFGTDYLFEDYEGNAEAEFFGVFNGELVYRGMQFTDHIRNNVVIMMILIFIIILVFLYFLVPRPLAKVSKCVSEYAETKDTDLLTKELSSIKTRNEIGAFADKFSALALEMERYTKEMEELAAEKERVETELNVAQNIQMQMLPHVFPESKDFALCASMNPAKEVGGDFYDCYMLDDDHLVLTIADVSGKGVPASLFMAVSKTMLKNRTQVGGKPSEILFDVNNWLCEGNDTCMFVTVWHGILTISTGELICANAGHENPGIRSGDGTFRLIRTEHGMMLGVMENITFADEEYKLNPGDALFVYTDGVPEANNVEEKMFGEDKLESVLSTVLNDDTPQTVMKKVRDAVDVFAGSAPQYDDLTMLCLVMNSSNKKD